MSDDEYVGAESLRVGSGGGGGGSGYRDSDSDEDAQLLSQMISSQATQSQVGGGGGVQESQPDLEVAYAMLEERSAQQALDAAANLVDPVLAANAAFWANRADVTPSARLPSLNNANFVSSEKMMPPSQLLYVFRDHIGRSLCMRHATVREKLQGQQYSYPHENEQYIASLQGSGSSGTVPSGYEWRLDASKGMKTEFVQATPAHHRRMLDTLAASLVATGDAGGAAQCLAARLALQSKPDPPPHVLELWLRLLEQLATHANDERLHRSATTFNTAAGASSTETSEAAVDAGMLDLVVDGGSFDVALRLERVLGLAVDRASALSLMPRGHLYQVMAASGTLNIPLQGAKSTTTTTGQSARTALEGGHLPPLQPTVGAKGCSWGTGAVPLPGRWLWQGRLLRHLCERGLGHRAHTRGQDMQPALAAGAEHVTTTRRPSGRAVKSQRNEKDDDDDDEEEDDTKGEEEAWEIEARHKRKRQAKKSKARAEKAARQAQEMQAEWEIAAASAAQDQDGNKEGLNSGAKEHVVLASLRQERGFLALNQGILAMWALVDDTHMDLPQDSPTAAISLNDNNDDVPRRVDSRMLDSSEASHVAAALATCCNGAEVGWEAACEAALQVAQWRLREQNNDQAGASVVSSSAATATGTSADEARAEVGGKQAARLPASKLRELITSAGGCFRSAVRDLPLDPAAHTWLALYLAGNTGDASSHTDGVQAGWALLRGLLTKLQASCQHSASSPPSGLAAAHQAALSFLARHPNVAADAESEAGTTATDANDSSTSTAGDDEATNAAATTACPSSSSSSLIMRLVAGWAAADPLAPEPITALLAAHEHATMDTGSSSGSSSSGRESSEANTGTGSSNTMLIAALCGHLDIAGAEPLAHESFALVLHRGDGAATAAAEASSASSAQICAAWRTLALLLVEADNHERLSSSSPRSDPVAWMQGRDEWWPHALLASNCVPAMSDQGGGRIGGLWRGRQRFVRKVQAETWSADIVTGAAAKAAVASRFFSESAPSSHKSNARLPAAAVVGVAFVLAAVVEKEAGRALLVSLGFSPVAMAKLEEEWRVDDDAQAAQKEARRAAREQPSWVQATAELLGTSAWRAMRRNMR